MDLLVRAALLLAATVPLFLATRFHTPIWQIFVAAAAGSALGQLAVRLLRGRPPWISIFVAAAALLVAAGSAVFFMTTPSAAKRRLLAVAQKMPPKLTLDDLTALESVPEVAAIAPVERGNVQLMTEENNWMTSVVGTTPAYLDVRGWHVAKGAIFSTADMTDAARVVVLGAEPAKQLFGAAEPVGQTIRMKNVPLMVVGILAPTGSPDTDDIALIPIPTFQKKIGGRFAGLFLILLRDGATSEPVRAFLRARHRLAPDADDDFSLRD